MLRIHLEEHAGEVILRLEGKLIDPWVEELVKVWMKLADQFPSELAVVHIDLEAVSFVDEHGKSMLRMLRRIGCQLQGSGPFISAIIEDSLAAGPHLGGSRG